MQISPAVWKELRQAVQFDDQTTCERLVTALVTQHLRDETARRAEADRAREVPFLHCQR